MSYCGECGRRENGAPCTCRTYFPYCKKCGNVWEGKEEGLAPICWNRYCDQTLSKQSRY